MSWWTTRSSFNCRRIKVKLILFFFSFRLIFFDLRRGEIGTPRIRFEYSTARETERERERGYGCRVVLMYVCTERSYVPGVHLYYWSREPGTCARGSMNLRKVRMYTDVWPSDRLVLWYPRRLKILLHETAVFFTGPITLAVTRDDRNDRDRKGVF